MKKIAYIMSRFPLITETFILREMTFLHHKGMQVYVYPLLFIHGVAHKEVALFTSRMTHIRVLALSVLKAQLYWLISRPWAYCALWIQALMENLTSLNFFLRAIVVIPKAAYFARHMVANNIDHVHAHFASHPALAAWVIHRLTNINYTFTTHAHDIYVRRAMLKTKIAESRHIITISDFNKNLLTRLYGKSIGDKVTVIRCGVDTNIYTPPENKKLCTPSLLICIASFNEYKGHTYLIDACRQLKQQGLYFRLFCIGDGILRTRIEQQIEQQRLHREVHLLGAQPQHRVLRLLRYATLLIQPSVIQKSGKMEGIPVALMEALALEVPVIATDISGISELVIPEKTGYLVPQRDSSALANTIEHALTNLPVSQQYAAAGRQKVFEEYNLQKNAQQVYTFLQQSTSAGFQDRQEN